MADRDRSQTQQQQGHLVPLQHHRSGPRKGPSTSQIIAVITLLPVGGTLLGLAGITLVGTLIGLAVTTPLFVICSPVLVPAALLFGLVVTGLFSSGALGLTGISSLAWALNYFRSKYRSEVYGTKPVPIAL